MEHVDQSNSISTIDAKQLTRQMAAFGRPTRTQNLAAMQHPDSLCRFVVCRRESVRVFGMACLTGDSTLDRIHGPYLYRLP